MAHDGSACVPHGSPGSPPLELVFPSGASWTLHVSPAPFPIRGHRITRRPVSRPSEPACRALAGLSYWPELSDGRLSSDGKHRHDPSDGLGPSRNFCEGRLHLGYHRLGLGRAPVDPPVISTFLISPAVSVGSWPDLFRVLSRHGKVRGLSTTTLAAFCSFNPYSSNPGNISRRGNERPGLANICLLY